MFKINKSNLPTFVCNNYGEIFSGFYSVSYYRYLGLWMANYSISDIPYLCDNIKSLKKEWVPARYVNNYKILFLTADSKINVNKPLPFIPSLDFGLFFRNNVLDEIVNKFLIHPEILRVESKTDSKIFSESNSYYYAFALKKHLGNYLIENLCQTKSSSVAVDLNSLHNKNSEAYKILFTSRESIDKFNSYDIFYSTSTMVVSEALCLFLLQFDLELQFDPIFIERK
jgi:hypothetical protein